VPDEYKVGRGRPPRHTRFKMGQSGNPKGRPRGSRNISAIIAQVMAEKIAVTENGRKRTIPTREAIIRGLRNDALMGNQKSRALLISIDFQMEARSAETEHEGGTSNVSQNDKEIMERFVERIRRQSRQEERQESKAQRVRQVAIRKLPRRLPD